MASLAHGPPDPKFEVLNAWPTPRRDKGVAEISHLQLVIQVVKNFHAEKQGMQWDRNSNFYVCLVPVHLLLSGMAGLIFYHVS